jgi:hypothetical protein
MNPPIRAGITRLMIHIDNDVAKIPVIFELNTCTT